jgi:Fe-Mn family superoxide dismutase
MSSRDLCQHNRRGFLKVAAACGAAASFTIPLLAQKNDQKADTPGTSAGGSPASMPPLPYAPDALAPHISEKTINLHYSRHHRSYYLRLKGYIDANREYRNSSLESLIRQTEGGILLDESIYNMAVLLYNHNLYWESLTPGGGGAPARRSPFVKSAYDSFGSFDNLKKMIIEAATKPGIGWVWLAQDTDSLVVYRTEYHGTPLVQGRNPLLCIDMWEHAYYLDYQDDRERYVDAVLSSLINWETAERRFKDKSGSAKSQ